MVETAGESLDQIYQLEAEARSLLSEVMDADLIGRHEVAVVMDHLRSVRAEARTVVLSETIDKDLRKLMALTMAKTSDGLYSSLRGDPDSVPWLPFSDAILSELDAARYAVVQLVPCETVRAARVGALNKGLSDRGVEPVDLPDALCQRIWMAGIAATKGEGHG